MVFNNCLLFFKICLFFWLFHYFKFRFLFLFFFRCFDSYYFKFFIIKIDKIIRNVAFSIRSFQRGWAIWEWAPWLDWIWLIVKFFEPIKILSSIDWLVKVFVCHALPMFCIVFEYCSQVILNLVKLAVKKCVVQGSKHDFFGV